MKHLNVKHLTTTTTTAKPVCKPCYSVEIFTISNHFRRGNYYPRDSSWRLVSRVKLVYNIMEHRLVSRTCYTRPCDTGVFLSRRSKMYSKVLYVDNLETQQSTTALELYNKCIKCLIKQSWG